MVTATQRRRAVDYLKSRRISERRACRLTGFSRSAAWRPLKGRGDVRLRARLKRLAEQYPKYGWARFDVPAFLAEIYEPLKPDGVLGIVDHDAVTDSGRDAGSTLHRPARQHVVDDLAAAGLVLEAESDVLRNPEDDHVTGVFDPAIRGRTDRYVLRFRKPAGN